MPQMLASKFSYTFANMPAVFMILVYDEPYLVAIVGGKLIEVRTLSPKVQIDSFQLPGAKIISRTKGGHIYAASNNSIWCLKSTPIETQIESLIKHKQFELALSLAVSSTRSVTCSFT